jgi:hypothetical protein
MELLQLPPGLNVPQANGPIQPARDQAATIG